jgi:hypothetical protein
MNNSLTTPIANALTSDLLAFTRLCEEILSLAGREHRALAGQGDYQPLEFQQERTALLPDIESLVHQLRNHRMVWQRVPQSQREHFTELKRVFQNVQGLLMKIMLLDRENQQAMLKRGLVPTKHLPPAAAQQPHYVADLYRKNSLA